MQDQLVNLESDLDTHARAGDLSRLVVTVATTAADERRGRFSDGLDELVAEVDLDAEAAKVGGVDLLEVLRGDGPDVTGRRAAALLLARGVSGALASDATAVDPWARRLSWLAANTWLDALWAVAPRLDDEGARGWWAALARLVRAESERGLPGGRGVAVVAASALSASSSTAATAERSALLEELEDPTLLAALRGSRSETAEAEDDGPKVGTALSGELVPAPLGAVGLVLQAVTGILLIRYVGRFIARLLGCRRPTHVTVGRERVTVSTELTVLGKTLRKREHVIPVAALAEAMREVRYPKMSLYAGLIALSVGTYFGASIATDGLRVGSPSLLGVGAAIIGLGLVIDLVFARLVPAGRGSHHVVFVPRRGRTLALAVADDETADRALRMLRA
ncbi:MAG: hypothetical protein RIF41_17985 [Polyangiaceae bacterium]